MQEIDDKRFMENMKKYIPPPLEILRKEYTNNEPVRTGFNMGLIPVKIKNSVEQGRSAQGPQIVITTTNNIRKENNTHDRAASRNSRRSRQESRDGSRQNSSRRDARESKVETPIGSNAAAVEDPNK
jgi:hypothetical protein